MSDADDRLAGDPVWELFPANTADDPVKRGWRSWIWTLGLLAISLPWAPAATPVVVAVASAWPDFIRSRRVRLAIPDGDAGLVAARFNQGWGLWKAGLAAFATAFAYACLAFQKASPPAGFVSGFLVACGAFLASAVLTAAGMRVAWQRGLKVWVGQGVNQARMLLMVMLMVGFVFAVMIPWLISLIGLMPPPGQPGPREGVAASYLVGSTFLLLVGSPVILLLLCDWFSRRVVAERPTKFGVKVPAVLKAK